MNSSVSMSEFLQHLDLGIFARAVQTYIALVVARAAVSLVGDELHALSSAALLREGALLLTQAAVFVVVLQVKALVVATCGVAPTFQAHVVVLLAVVGGSRVFLLLLEEPADTTCGRRFGVWGPRGRRGVGCFGRED